MFIVNIILWFYGMRIERVKKYVLQPWILDHPDPKRREIKNTIIPIDGSDHELIPIDGYTLIEIKKHEND